ncbi:MAG: Deoxycytidine triphosphate deaminase [Planctomycetes bacterium]|nr:Deoxycytidine triphosphate deaminase [Planctomycetota bacterium]
MTFWNTEKLLEKLKGDDPPILDADLNGVGDACYEMRLGAEAYISSTNTSLIHLDQVKTLNIPPGQFAILLTKESLRMPKNALGFISLKASVKLRGLVNVSGFHVDPGFEGHIKFSVFNASSKDITLRQGQPLFPIWFATLDGAEAGYDGSHQGQSSISGDDVMRLAGEVLSPAALKLRVDELAQQVADWKLKVIWGAVGLVVVLLTAVVNLVLALTKNSG